MDQRGEVTRLLSRLGAGDRGAMEDLLPIVYEELRRIARAHLRRERKGHSLQTTALTHEAYLRLAARESMRWSDRVHFLSVAAQAMRRVLVEHARARGRKKRGGGYRRVTLDDQVAAPAGSLIDLVALDAALEKLAAVDPRKARVVELLYFGGLSAAEAAECTGTTSRTVERDWRYARLWLLRELAGQGSAIAGREPDAASS